MKSLLICLVLALCNGCQSSCPARLVEAEEYEGEGFVLSHNPANSFVVFYPACVINQQHYLASVTANNLGQGITVPIYDLQYASAIINTNGRFKLTKYPVDQYSYQGIYLLPARIKYHDLAYDTPILIDHPNYSIEKTTIITPYARASIELDTLIILPYAP